MLAPISLQTLRNSILYRLGEDTAGSTRNRFWASGEITRYIKEGYRILCRRARLLWETAYLETVSGTATYTLPTNWQEIDRVTWDGRRIEPLGGRQARDNDFRYRTIQGEVYAYVLQDDGINTIRLVRVPAANAGTFTVTGTWGILRSLTDLSTETVTGTWGVPRRIPAMHPMVGEFGIPRRPNKEYRNCRVEYWRNPIAVSDGRDTFELPNRYVKYLRWYAMWKAYERTGPGQDLELAEHYKTRWDAAVVNAGTRQDRVKKARVGILGGFGGRRMGRPPYPSMPWQYARPVRGRRY